MPSENFLDELKETYRNLRNEMMRKFERHVSFGDLISDRWETAKAYGFGEESSCYDNVLIKGEVSVGRHTWIGPNCILDGVGGLTIGDYCSVSAGVQIYTHDTVNWSISLGAEPEDRAPVTIGNGVYLGPNTVVEKGITIGDRAVIGAMSFVNSDIPPGSRVRGCPARVL
jgi:acetyltransferase-like isoleucine patch superfamily enzyme